MASGYALAMSLCALVLTGSMLIYGTYRSFRYREDDSMDEMVYSIRKFYDIYPDGDIKLVRGKGRAGSKSDPVEIRVYRDADASVYTVECRMEDPGRGMCVQPDYMLSCREAKYIGACTWSYQCADDALDAYMNMFLQDGYEVFRRVSLSSGYRKISDLEENGENFD